jgi:hypothetical protein
MLMYSVEHQKVKGVMQLYNKNQQDALFTFQFISIINL